MSDPTGIENKFAARLKADFDEAERVKAERIAEAAAAFAPINKVVQALSAAVAGGKGAYGQITQSQHLHVDDWGNSDLEIQLRRRDGRTKRINVRLGPSFGSGPAYFVGGIAETIASERFPASADVNARQSDRDLRFNLDDVESLNGILEEDITKFFVPAG